MSSKRRSSSRYETNRTPDPSAYEGDAGAPSAEPTPLVRQPGQDTDRIGDILRRVREHRGEDLESVSAYLCIRPHYLYALENSHYEELPADAYVIGFLRSYAGYLGLDGKGAIDQYRREMAGRRNKPRLNMPQPMPEGRAPTFAVLAGAAVAALLVYGVWYGLSSPNEDLLNRPVDTALIEQTEKLAPVETTAATSTTDGAAITQTATSDGIALAVPEDAVASKPLPDVPQDAIVVESAAVPETTKVAEKKPDEKKEEAKKEELKKEEAKKEEPKKEEPKKEDVKKEALSSAITTAPLPLLVPAAAPAAATTTTSAAQPAPETAAPETAKAEPPAPAPASYGSAAQARMVVTAEVESWLMITDKQGNTVFERTLKPGETYHVPRREGLNLTTGNAGGLTFTLDGAKLSKMKTTNKVVRAVPLEPDQFQKYLANGN